MTPALYIVIKIKVNLCPVMTFYVICLFPELLPLMAPFFLVVTEEELALALAEGEEVITSPGPAAARSTNGLREADSEYDPLSSSMEETK